jgi:hypothetical protein
VQLMAFRAGPYCSTLAYFEQICVEADRGSHLEIWGVGVGWGRRLGTFRWVPPGATSAANLAVLSRLDLSESCPVFVQLKHRRRGI